MYILTKEDYIKNLHTNLDEKLKLIASSKGFPQEAYEGVKSIIIDTAEFSFEEGFEAARQKYGIAYLNHLNEIFKK